MAKMFTLTQVLVPVVLLSAVAFGLPLTENGDDDFRFGFPVDAISEDRIFGGQEAAIGQFPHQISLRVGSGNRFRHHCGGSIISNRWILTAAHCLPRNPQTNRYRVVVGAHLNNGNDGVHHNVSRIIVHPQFLINLRPPNATIRNDVALIQTAETIQFNNLVRAIPLHRDFIEIANGTIVSGWGRTNDRITNLKFVSVNTLTNARCRVSFVQWIRGTPPVHDWDTICAFGRRGHGICSGDSGGPLILQNRLIGVVSWGLVNSVGRCAVGVPDGYMRVSNYLQWIDSNIAT